MNWLENSHEIITSLLIGAWIVGLAFLIIGKRAREREWVAVSVLVLVLVGLAIDLFFVEGSLSGQQKIWTRGWIGPRDQEGAITIGIVEDAIGLTVAICAALVGALLSFNRGIIRREASSERALSGLVMSVVGVSIAWLALTPWLSILGLTLTTLAGAVLLGSSREPDLIARFGTERAWGFVLAFLGAAVLAGARHQLTLQQGFAFSAAGLPHVFDWIGGLLLVAGLYFHLHPFPFLGWLSRAPKVSVAASAIVCQLFPALACFALMIRFEPELRSIGVFEVFDWVALSSAVLVAICGLAQPTWKTALPFWLSCSLTFAFAALCFSGGETAFAILIGTVLSGSALSLIASAPDHTATGGRSGRIKVLLFTALAPGMGLIGFVGSGGLIQLMSQGAENPAVATPLCLALILCNLLLWKVAFAIAAPDSKEASDSKVSSEKGSWIYLLAGWLLIALSLGLLWTGTLTGGAIPGDPDRLLASWMSEMFGVKGAVGSQAGVDVGLGEGLYSACIVVPALISFWLFGRKQDLVIKAMAGSPRLRGFLESGYSVDRVGAWIKLALRRTGEFLEKWISEKISIELIPLWLERGLRAPAKWSSEADRKVYLREEQTLRQWIEVPAKALQLVQNGDVQWYLFFAIGSIVAILIHFLWHNP